MLKLLGYSLGLKWIDGDYHRSLLLAAYHHPRSLTWRWAISWHRRLSYDRRLRFMKHNNGWDFAFTLPCIGGLRLNTQHHVFRKKGKA